MGATIAGIGIIIAAIGAILYLLSLIPGFAKPEERFVLPVHDTEIGALLPLIPVKPRSVAVEQAKDRERKVSMPAVVQSDLNHRIVSGDTLLFQSGYRAVVMDVDIFPEMLKEEGRPWRQTGNKWKACYLSPEGNSEQRLLLYLVDRWYLFSKASVLSQPDIQLFKNKSQRFGQYRDQNAFRWENGNYNVVDIGMLGAVGGPCRFMLAKGDLGFLFVFDHKNPNTQDTAWSHGDEIDPSYIEILPEEEPHCSSCGHILKGDVSECPRCGAQI